ncbi:glycosyltransferase [Paractinoplanes durhamensis]|uniref:glycosyltransferase n=1 Tax=Paractinoplanes durhamensis TaxID=113563 RepID=UPI00362591FD
MKIAHFCDSQPGRPDGVARSAELTVELLRAAGHQVDLYRPGPLLSRGGVRSIPVPFRQVRVGLPFTPGPADVVHVHSTGPIGMTGFRAAAAWRVPMVLTWHTDLLAYADMFAEIPVGAAWCALRLGLGWSPREFLELTRPGVVRQDRLIELGKGMFARAAVAIAPSAKTAAGFAVFEPAAEIRVLPTPVPPIAPGPERTGGNVVLSVGRATAEKNRSCCCRRSPG